MCVFCRQAVPWLSHQLVLRHVLRERKGAAGGGLQAAGRTAGWQTGERTSAEEEDEEEQEGFHRVQK